MFFVSEQYPGDPWTFNLHWQIISLFIPFRNYKNLLSGRSNFLQKMTEDRFVTY